MINKISISSIISIFLASSVIANTAVNIGSQENNIEKNDPALYVTDQEKYSSLSFGSENHYDDNLIHPSAYFDGSTVVTVGQNQNDNHDLFYRTGSPKNGEISWHQAGGFSLDTIGYAPKVAVTSNGTVVEVHLSSTTEEQKLYYRTGTLSSDKLTIQWNGWYSQYDTGSSPSIVALGNKIIEVHESYGKLYYKVADVSNEHTLNWVSGGNYYDSGRKPTITVSGDTIVTTHATDEGLFSNGDMFYRTGQLNIDNKIDWYQNEGAYKFGDGGSPTVTTIKGDVIMVAYYHEIPLIKPSESPDNLQSIFYRTGKLDSNHGIEWYQKEDSTKNTILNMDSGGYHGGTIFSFSTMTTNDGTYLFYSTENGSFYKSASI